MKATGESCVAAVFAEEHHGVDVDCGSGTAMSLGVSVAPFTDVPIVTESYLLPAPSSDGACDFGNPGITPCAVDRHGTDYTHRLTDRVDAPNLKAA